MLGLSLGKHWYGLVVQMQGYSLVRIVFSCRGGGLQGGFMCSLILCLVLWNKRGVPYAFSIP